MHYKVEVHTAKFRIWWSFFPNFRLKKIPISHGLCSILGQNSGRIYKENWSKSFFLNRASFCELFSSNFIYFVWILYVSFIFCVNFYPLFARISPEFCPNFSSRILPKFLVPIFFGGGHSAPPPPPPRTPMLMYWLQLLGLSYTIVRITVYTIKLNLVKSTHV